MNQLRILLLMIFVLFLSKLYGQNHTSFSIDDSVLRSVVNTGTTALSDFGFFIDKSNTINHPKDLEIERFVNFDSAQFRSNIEELRNPVWLTFSFEVSPELTKKCDSLFMLFFPYEKEEAWQFIDTLNQNKNVLKTIAGMEMGFPYNVNAIDRAYHILDVKNPGLYTVFLKVSFWTGNQYIIEKIVNQRLLLESKSYV